MRVQIHHPCPTCGHHHGRSLWDMLAEPKVITALHVVVYVVLATAGWVAWVDQPEISVWVAGELMTDVWGWLLMVSSALGIAGCLPGIWWLERGGVIGVATACVMQLAIISGGHLDGGALPIHAAFVLAVLLLMAVRWHRIRLADLDPARTPRRQA